MDARHVNLLRYLEHKVKETFRRSHDLEIDGPCLLSPRVPLSNLITEEQTMRAGHRCSWPLAGEGRLTDFGGAADGFERRATAAFDPLLNNPI